MVHAKNPNTFAGNPLDRASHLRGDAHWLDAARRAPQTAYLPLWQLRPRLRAAPDAAGQTVIGWVGAAELEGLDLAHSVLLGRDGERAFFAIDVSDVEESELAGRFGADGGFEDLLFALARLDADSAALLAQARSMVDWHRRHGFCAQCGAPTVFADAGYRRDCPQCAAQHFPRTDPVVIAIVEKDGRCLLGRNAMFRGPMFSALAGFLEPGETIEEAVAREVFEEVGVAVEDVTYQFAQPWPFPSSLMIGCIARALSDAITLDEKEIAEARWFTRGELRAAIDRSAGIDYREMMRDGDVTEVFVPPGTAIAHQLMQVWLSRDTA